ncbi:MAG: hypothetical protein PHY57_09460 [Ignavibacterium sp.]|jgi:hypothetical protein|nr:MAG: hypothetical protein F9K42_09565 [Ignavibacterium sp.]MDD5608728.1 hypothetical protein [Ignavibacterium sp.]
MKRKKSSSGIIVGIILSLVLGSFLQAQPLSKRIGGKSLKERIHQTLVPFDYSNYKKVGPISRDVYARIRQAHNTEKIASVNTVVSITKPVKEQSFFLKQKRHSASFKAGNKTYISVKRKSVKNFFLDGKRHQ